MNHAVQKVSTVTRGRPPAHDTDDVVARATAVFWAEGSEVSTVEALERATGVNRSTLYTSLGGKSGLFDRCLRGYIAGAESLLLQPALVGSAGLDDLVALVERVGAMLDVTENPPGCFAIRSLMRGEGEERAQHYVEQLRSAITAALHRATEVDGLEPALTVPRAALIEAALLGMLALGRSPGVKPRPLVEGLIAQIRAWAPTTADSAR